MLCRALGLHKTFIVCARMDVGVAHVVAMV